MAAKVTTAPQQTTTTIQPTMDSNQHTTIPLDTNIGSPIEESSLVESQAEPKSRLSWTESPADQPKTTKKPGRQAYNTVIYLVVSAQILGQGKNDNHIESWFTVSLWVSVLTGVCKDTVASISEPVQHNLYGLRDGAWMKDARGHGNVIYLTNGHYGNILQEFRDMKSFKSGLGDAFDVVIDE